MDKVRYGIIGMGMGAAHLQGVKDCPIAECVAICDNNEEKLKKVSEEKGVYNTYTDYKEMLKRDDIDAVIVCSPDQIHRQMVIDSFNAGKHVMCEKPLALNLDDCKAMMAASRETDKKFMVGQVCRMTPGFILAKKLIDAGEIGELFFVESEYAHDYSDMDATSWRRHPERHGVVGGGCHAVDLLRWYAGNPTEVYAYSTQKVLTQWPTADTTIALLKFPNNVNGKVLVSTGCKRDYTMRTVIYGTHGTIIVDNTNPQLSLFRDTFDGEKKYMDCDSRSIEVKLPININNHNVAAEVQEFSEVLVNGKELKITGYEGTATVSVCMSIIKSTKTGKTEIVDYDF